MRNFVLFFHLAAAMIWMGGMAFMLLALRGPVAAQLQPPVRLPLLAAVLGRFFALVGLSIAVLLGTGLALLLGAQLSVAPPGWHAMAALGVAMMLIFGHLFFSPYRRLKAAVAAADWAEGGRRMAQITLLARINFALGWLAIAAALFWR